jgi:hypothetical protein
MGDPVPMTWHFTVTGDTIPLEPVIPQTGTSSDCRWSLSKRGAGLDDVAADLACPAVVSLS